MSKRSLGWKNLVRRMVPGGLCGRVMATLLQDGVIRGLARAREILAAIPGERLSYRELVRDERHLWRALERLYPGGIGPCPRHIDEALRRQREEVAARLRSRGYRRFGRRVSRMLVDCRPATVTPPA